MIELIGVRRGNRPFDCKEQPPVMTWADLLERLMVMPLAELAKPVLFAQSLAMDKPELYEAVFVIAREEINVDEWGEPLEEGTYFLTSRETDE